MISLAKVRVQARLPFRTWFTIAGLLGPLIYANAETQSLTLRPSTGITRDMVERATSLLQSVAPEANEIKLVTAGSEIWIDGNELKATVSIDGIDSLGRLVARSVWDSKSGDLISVEHFRASFRKSAGEFTVKPGEEAWRWLRVTGLVGQDMKWRLAGLVPTGSNRVAAMLVGSRAVTVITFDNRSGEFHSAKIIPRSRGRFLA